MGNAPAAAKKVAEALRSAMPNLDSLPLNLNRFAGYDPKWAGGEVIVISSPGEDPKQSCIAALGVQEEHVKNMTEKSDAAFLSKMEYTMGWVDTESKDDDVKEELLKGWKIFKSSLKDTFWWFVSDWPPKLKAS